MKCKKCQDTVLDACSEKVQNSTKRGISRRKFVQTSAGVAAAGALLGKRAFAAPRPIKIGYVSPETGALAPFGETDDFVMDAIRKVAQGGIPAGGATRQVEILVRDSQSSQNRCAQVAAELIKADKIDLMLVASTPDTVNPVADQCEINQVPCVSTDAPWEPYLFGRGGDLNKGFDWTYHYFWGASDLAENACDMFDDIQTNKVLGIIQANDIEGVLFTDPVKGFPPIFKKRGYTVVDPGRFDLNTSDFTTVIEAYKKANVQVLQGNVPLHTFSTLWTQMHQQGFKPKAIVASKATDFVAAIEALGPLGKNLAIEVWWSPAHPFKSNLTGQTAAQICQAYEDFKHKEWTILIGFRYSLFEVAFDVFKRAQNPESSASVIDAIRKTKINTLVGPVQWQGPPPNPWTQLPAKNLCTTPLLGGQWVPGKKWMYDLVVTDNRRYPLVPVQRKAVPLEY